MPRKLKIWNGRGAKDGEHYFVAAHSQADAVEMLRAAGHHLMSLHELRHYFSEGCWGLTMEGVTPERGVWLARGYPAKPERVI